jgi:hypothetical protein
LRTSLFIRLSLLPGGSPRRDEADHVVLAFFPDGAGHEQQKHPSGKAERLPSWFACFVGPVLLE